MEKGIFELLFNLKEISTVAMAGLGFWWFILERKELKQQLKEKDERIRQVINNHQNDLKESNKDLQNMSEKWTVVFSQLKDIIK